MLIDPEPRPRPGWGTVMASLSYSLDSGSTWNPIYSSTGNRAKQYDSITIPTSQDLTKVQVKATCAVNSGGAISVELDIYELRLEVTT